MAGASKEKKSEAKPAAKKSAESKKTPAVPAGKLPGTSADKSGPEVVAVLPPKLLAKDDAAKQVGSLSFMKTVIRYVPRLRRRRA